MRVFTQNDELEKIKHKQKKIIEETKKLRKDPKTYLRPLNIKKIQRSNSAKFGKRYGKIDMSAPESPANYKVNVRKAKLLKMKSSLFDLESRNFSKTAEKLRNHNVNGSFSVSESGSPSPKYKQRNIPKSFRDDSSEKDNILSLFELKKNNLTEKDENEEKEENEETEVKAREEMEEVKIEKIEEVKNVRVVREEQKFEGEENTEHLEINKEKIKEQRSRKIDDIRDKFVMILSNLTKKKTMRFSKSPPLSRSRKSQSNNSDVKEDREKLFDRILMSHHSISSERKSEFKEEESVKSLPSSEKTEEEPEFIGERGFFAKIVLSKYFQLFIMLSILINTILLCMERYPMSNEEKRTLEYFNIIFTVIFAGEMALRLIALGIKGYLRDRFNIFD